MSSWIPEADLKLVALCNKWLSTLKSNDAISTCRWDANLCENAIAKIEPFVAAHNAFQTLDTSENRAVKNETKREAVKAIRAFAKSSVRYNPYMTDAYRIVLNIHKPDNTPTPQLRPTARPNTMAERTSNYFEHKVSALNVETGKATKPAGVYGVRIVWQAGGERPATGANILNGRFSRRTSIIVAYDETDRGKKVYYASCYENSKGEAGPWSPVVEAYIG